MDLGKSRKEQQMFLERESMIKERRASIVGGGRESSPEMREEKI